MDKPVDRRFFGLLLAGVSVAFCWILLPFFSAIFWGVILALLFMPLQQRMLGLWQGRRNAAAFTTLMICLVIVIIPVIFIAASLVQEGASVYQRIRSGDLNLGLWIEQIRSALPPTVQQWLQGVGIGDFSGLRDRLSAGAMQGSQFLAGQAVNIGQNTLQFVISFGVMLYLLFFLLRDGVTLARRIRQAIPLSPRQKHQLLSKFIAVTRATVKGNIIVAATQGALGGIAFWLLGIEAPLLWGVVMAFLSLLPAIGAGLIWAPVAIWLMAIGDIGRGVILIAVGVLVIGMVDNVLRPILVGKDTKLPDYVVLISTLGGMALFGINGFVIGPLIAALFISAWDLLATETDSERPR
ncbi:AI-2E family transporter [Kushneria phosphatilytica]|uniref:AI-2E family transporter n=1 Tax=Kushneria phosphatilytica TaxID=657387 RepID=A0A1S1NYH6_9GAMM|nr:AI-2E family transporter [Kushneria phosphatilytica]OHV12731.1 AI-2E family transporter [Kushneria phosphatilytica]QEL10573.1 AI-2E family transporter [Kushneria phosphatilytica]